MAGMERFTQRARRVLSLAHQEAERARQNSIGTEHLLLGLMDEEGGVAGRVLRELGMTPDRVREVVARVSATPTTFDPDRIELAAETQQVLEFAVEEARRLGHHYIGTEHILLGLVRVESVAMEVLRRLGVTPDQIRRQTRRVLNESASSSPTPATAPQGGRNPQAASNPKTPLVDQLA
ncbi:MAG: Clp protease N-terminal domain-containing protein, partial [bacterium]|nr:Clp protease N-terminal domain-containing protein [bacterium]